MSVRIRLQRHGRKQRPYYYIVIADSRSKRDGKFIERLGSYNPMTNPATIEVDGDKALDWLLKGAEPSDTVRAILSYKGILMRKHLQVGVIKGALTQEEADAKFASWLEEKSGKIQEKIQGLESAAGEEARIRLEREAAVASKRAEALRALEAEAAPEAEEAGDDATEATADEAAPAGEDAPSEEPKAE